MRVMVMIKGHGVDEERIAPTTEMFEEMGRYNEELVKAGIMLGGDGLKPTSAGARVVFAAGGDTSVVDGPFAESKEIVAGYWIWQVSSMAEAVEWAKRCPHDAYYGAEQVLEVRPFFEPEDFADQMTPELLSKEADLARQIREQHPGA
ncbi:YciI family protein [Catenuloplanes sp. NPDC051500]|uniref:YciI family protein n=1 Tax=Catenuloplanes sp. NPDC051500 TaxID=3363959 RepID=UPI0037AE46FF